MAMACASTFCAVRISKSSKGHNKTHPKRMGYSGAGDEARTRYLHLGKVALYRMSYTRISQMHDTL